MGNPEPLLRRRNGRPQACDPCRRRKVSCDHSQPVCLRCRKRNQASSCVYTISSHSNSTSIHHSSRSRQAAHGRASSSRAANASVSTSSGNTSASMSASTSTSSSAPVPVSATNRGSAGASKLTAHLLTAASSHPSPNPTSTAAASPTAQISAGGRAGYLGFTSYSAVYEETRDSLSRLQGLQSQPVSTLTPASRRPSVAHAHGLPSILSSPTREMCLAVLRSLPDLDFKDIAPRWTPHSTDGWARVAASRILSSLRSCLAAGRADSHLDEVAQMLCANTSRPMSDDVANLDRWIEQFTGPNLRWESLALLCMFTELFADATAAERGLSRSERYHRSWKEVALTCVGLCIELAKCFTDGNLLLLYVCFRRTIMESVAGGDAGTHYPPSVPTWPLPPGGKLFMYSFKLTDAGLACWRAHAESVSLLTFLGLHAEPDSPSYVPTFSSEMRRRMFAVIFNIDKVCVSFQGRPPLVCHRYVSTPLPLDIPDEDFCGTQEAFSRAVGCLDDSGWNATGAVSVASVLRSRAMLSYLRDELIEVALSHRKHTSVDALLDIKARATDVNTGFPEKLTYNQHDLGNRDLPVEVIYARILIRIEYLQNLFFAERLLLRRGHPDDGELLRISFEMVTLTLTFWLHKDLFADVRADIEWLVMNYAAPGGGILCMELLKPTLSGPHPRDPGISRSSIIQQLSLLLGFLGWVSPDAPNADLCASCRTVIQHVLDHTLNNGPVAVQQSIGDTLGQVDAEGLFFNFDLLDTFDWLRPDDMTWETST